MHIEDERRRHGLNLPVFAVAHSMGGMLTIRLALDVPDLFSAIVLVGPLVLFGSSPIMRHLPVSSIWPPLNGLAQWLKKKLTPLADILDWRFQIGHTEVANATKDPYMQHLLKADSLRHFGGVYLPMLTGFSQEIANNLRDMGNMTTPFCILFGSDDPLCNIGGAWQMYFSCHRVRKVDKVMMEFEHAAHQVKNP